MKTETTGERQLFEKWNFGNLPPEGHKDVGRFFNMCWEDARREKIDRLQLHQRMLDLHALWRGQRGKRKGSYPKFGMNYLFKTIRGHCAILTEKQPQFEISCEDAPDEVKQAISESIKIWWNDREQQNSLFASVQNMSVYGTTIEKGVLNAKTGDAEIVLKDAFCFFPAPGGTMCNMEKLPYCCDIDFMDTWEVSAKFNVDKKITIPSDADEQLYGKDRETVRGGKDDHKWRGGNLPSNYSEIEGKDFSEDGKKTLVVEVWARDYSTKTEPIYEEQEVEGVDPETGETIPLVEKVKVGTRKLPKYPGGIRKVVICPALMDAECKGVLDDTRNPNINWGLYDYRISQLVEYGTQEPAVDESGNQIIDPATNAPAMQTVEIDEDTARDTITEQFAKMFLWNNFPFSAIPFYFDTSQWWGFAAIEVLEEVQGKAEGLLTKYLAYLDRAMFPILILPKECGVKKSQITNELGLVIEPTLASSTAIRYVQVPQAPKELLEMVMFLLQQEDILSGSPEVTEGRRPTGVSAATAIIALQDKAATVFQPLIRQIDHLIRNRGRMYMSFLMNFGTKEVPIEIDDGVYGLCGTSLEGEFSMTVESGSSAPITKAGRRQQYIELYGMQAMDLETLLTRLEIPDAQTIIERLTEQNSLPGAIDILIQAGMPEEEAKQLYQMLMQGQGGTGRAGVEKKPERAGGYSEGLNQAKDTMGELKI